MKKDVGLVQHFFSVALISSRPLFVAFDHSQANVSAYTSFRPHSFLSA
jgi:hypothetical protein